MRVSAILLAAGESRRMGTVNKLALPVGDAYASYAALGRPFVAWNVFAAPEFSLAPREWCYPLVGCLAYRGYFDRAAAAREADRLAASGEDADLGVARKLLERGLEEAHNLGLREEVWRLQYGLAQIARRQQRGVRGSTESHGGLHEGGDQPGLHRHGTGTQLKRGGCEP